MQSRHKGIPLPQLVAEVFQLHCEGMLQAVDTMHHVEPHFTFDSGSSVLPSPSNAALAKALWNASERPPEGPL